MSKIVVEVWMKLNKGLNYYKKILKQIGSDIRTHGLPLRKQLNS